MATIQHQDIPDGERHEPKGIATATSGQIYVADGATSGVWTAANDALTAGGVLATNGLSVASNESVDFLQTSFVKVAGGDGWKDLIGQISVRGSGVNDPSWSLITGSTAMWGFQFSPTTMQQFWIAFHINHDYAMGTPIYPHVHWLNAAAAPDTQVVRWGFEYAVARGHNQQAFPMLATTTVYVNQACPSTRYQHNIAELALADAVPATSLEVDSIVYMRVFRDAADAADTCTDPVYVLAADCHYQSNTIATKNKSPNFYV